MCSDMVEGTSLLEQIPPELLAKTLSLLPFNSYLACHRVCRKFRKTINEVIIYMPKTTVTKVNVEYTSGKVTLVVTRARFNSPRKSWSCSFVEDPSAEVASTSNATVAEFFDQKGLSGMKWDAASKSVEFRVQSPEASLVHCMRFLCSKAYITLLSTVDLSESGAQGISDVIKSCGSRVFHLKMVIRRPVSTAEMELIKHANCQTIDIRREVPSAADLLFRNPTIIGKAWAITVLGDADEPLPLNDDFLRSTSAESICVRGITAISSEGVAVLVKKWLLGERQIANISLGTSLRPDDLRPTLLSLDAVPTSQQNEWQLKRRTDGEPLTIGFSEEHELEMFAEPYSNEDEAEDEEEDMADGVM